MEVIGEQYERIHYEGAFFYNSAESMPKGFNIETICQKGLSCVGDDGKK
ncbi:hypothetical protein HORIV_22640 [Vreelandella olivaria]|uniref:Uncharacterized protein n=1 Tax=Vreelandella olivaria TaxID=390919 RepID=A0ABM7GGZ0_9GAMM|nr:hypothetical protein HORIV_22640 [Halomonas olivaria]